MANNSSTIPYELKNIILRKIEEALDEVLVAQPFALAESCSRSHEERHEKKYQFKLSNSHYDFVNFIAGDSNKLLKAVSIDVAQKFRFEHNPLFIYGSTGTGKTHLLKAIAKSRSLYSPDELVIYIHAEQYISDMLKSSQASTLRHFHAHYQHADLILIDDLDFFADKERSQEELCRLIDARLESHTQLVFSSNSNPSKIKGFDQRLISRFVAGLSIEITPPDLEARKSILRHKARQQGLELSIEIIQFIAQNSPTDIRKLEGALHRLTANTEFYGEGMSLDDAQKILAGFWE